MASTPRTRKGKLVACKCRDFEGHRPSGGSGEVEILTTGCTAQTNRMFAQGHDAKLVSNLVRWQLEECTIAWGRHSAQVLSMGDAVNAAASVSEALAVKTERALCKAMERRIAQQAREDTRARERAARGARPERPAVQEPEQPAPAAPAARTARIKVGRWTYTAQIDGDGTATYQSKLGGQKTVTKGNYTVLA